MTHGSRYRSSGWRGKRSAEGLKWSKQPRKRTISSRNLCVTPSSPIIRRPKDKGTVQNRMMMQGSTMLKRGLNWTQCSSIRESCLLQRSTSVVRAARRMSQLLESRISSIQGISSSMMARRSKSERRKRRSLVINRKSVASKTGRRLNGSTQLKMASKGSSTPPKES